MRARRVVIGTRIRIRRVSRLEGIVLSTKRKEKEQQQHAMAGRFDAGVPAPFPFHASPVTSLPEIVPKPRSPRLFTYRLVSSSSGHSIRAVRHQSSLMSRGHEHKQQNDIRVCSRWTHKRCLCLCFCFSLRFVTLHHNLSHGDATRIVSRLTV